MKKYILIGFLGFGALFMLLFFNKSNIEKEKITAEKIIQNVKKHDVKITFQEKEIEKNIKEKDIDIVLNEKEELKEDNIVSELNEAYIEVENDIQPVFTFTYNKELEIGEKLVFPFTEVNIEKIEYKGKQQLITTNKGIFTANGNSFFGTISAENDNYEVEVVNGQGVVYKQEDLDTRIDYSKGDTIKIES